ncbi:BlaI/MecI/CopY family transcriptional regulator [Microbacterium sp. NPDC077391]|uniref:BlaI/MecI/CopY family transcriptional regulator n=1 Tax=Microbacterium sp. NPDC077391 TaxID=3154765 RepID=UPI003438C4B3
MPGERTRERGELESEIMRILWDSAQPVSAREIQEQFTGHTPAYTTVMTALERLHQKGQVVRSGDSPRKVRFHAAQSEDEHASVSMMTALDGAEDRQAALLSFAGNLAAEDVELLRAAITSGSSRKRR